MKKKFAILACALVLAVGLVPGLAFAATTGDLQASTPNLAAQDANDLGNCTIKFTDKKHVCDDGANWQMYYAKGKDASVTPTFNLYLNGKLVPKSAYTVSYKLTYWSDKKDKDVAVNWNKPLTPSASPVSNTENMSSEYILVVNAKSGSGYAGTYDNAHIDVVDYYNVGRNMDMYFAKAKSSMQYFINPMNGNYYVFPQSSVKSILGSLTLRAGCTPGDGVMVHNGTKVASKYYSVTYYKALKDAVEENRSPASANLIKGTKTTKMPTAAGSYVMIVKGKSPYYGTASVYFDIQGSMKDVTISKVAAKTENGKYIEPGVKVTYKGETLKEGVDYDVEYTKNLKAGTATAKITGAKVLNNDQGSVDFVDKPRYFTGSKTVKFTIKKNAKKTWLDNTMTAKANTVTVSKAKLMERDTQEVKASKAFTVAKAKGAVRYEKLAGSSLISVSRTGDVTVEPHAGWYSEKLKDNTFNIKVKILAKGNSSYYALAKTVTLKVKVA